MKKVIEREKILGIKRGGHPRKNKAIAWNKGLTKKDDPRIGKQGWKEEDRDRMRKMVSDNLKGKPKSEEQKMKRKQTMLLNKSIE